MSGWAAELVEMRAAWAKRPRLPTPGWFPTPPAWAADDPVFNGTHAADLWAQGDVDWGWVLMANNAAWEAGTVIAPGAVLFTDDVVLRRNPFRMSEVSERVWAMRKAPPTRVGVRAFKPWALDDNAPNPVQRVPHVFTEGRVVWVGGVLMQRDSLVDRRLQHSLIPIVRTYSHALSTIALAPLLAWSEGLKVRWAPDEAPTETPPPS